MEGRKSQKIIKIQKNEKESECGFRWKKTEQDRMKRRKLIKRKKERKNQLEFK